MEVVTEKLNTEIIKIVFLWRMGLEIGNKVRVVLFLLQFFFYHFHISYYFILQKKFFSAKANSIWKKRM